MWRMYRDYPELARPPAEIKLAAPPRREIECLESGEGAALLDWLRVNRRARSRVSWFHLYLFFFASLRRGVKNRPILKS
jgi:hypothetical protein